MRSFRRSRAGLAAGVFTLSVGLGLGLGAPPAGAAGATTSFTAAIDCPSTLECITVGASVSLTSLADRPFIAATADGGATWWDQAAPAGAGQLRAVTCPTTKECFAAGDRPGGGTQPTLIATTDGGTNWTDETLPPAAAAMTSIWAVRCPTASRCYALAGNQQTETEALITTTDGGATWTYEPGPTGFSFATGLSCPGTETCFVAGDGVTTFAYQDHSTAEVAATFDGGRTWVDQLDYFPATGDSYTEAGLQAVSCPTATTCLTAGSGIWGTTDSGHAWTLRAGTGASDQPENPSSVDCPRAADCYVATPGGVEVSTNGGWTYTDPDGATGANFVALSCPTYFRCYATDGLHAEETADSGATWKTETIPGTGYAG